VICVRLPDRIPIFDRIPAVVVSVVVGLGVPAAHGISSALDDHSQPGAAIPLAAPAPQIEMATVANQSLQAVDRVQYGSVVS
jgi:hypothetical protein